MKFIQSPSHYTLFIDHTHSALPTDKFWYVGLEGDRSRDSGRSLHQRSPHPMELPTTADIFAMGMGENTETLGKEGGSKIVGGGGREGEGKLIDKSYRIFRATNSPILNTKMVM